MTISPESIAWLRQSARVSGAAVPQVLLGILERLDALESAQQPADHVADANKMVLTPEAVPMATDEELRRVADAHRLWSDSRRACYNLGREHNAAAQPTPPPAPVGGLVKRVAASIWKTCNMVPMGLALDIEARVAIREVAAWMRENYGGREGYGTSWANLLEEEADR